MGLSKLKIGPTPTVLSMMLVIGFIVGPLDGSAQAQTATRWYGIGKQFWTEATVTDVQHEVPHLGIGSRSSTQPVRLRCASSNAAAEPNFVLMNVWAVWRSGTTGTDARFMETHPEYRCGEGESRRREGGLFIATAQGSDPRESCSVVPSQA